MDSIVRFGVIVAGDTLATWQIHCIADLVQQLGARLEVIIVQAERPDTTGGRSRSQISTWHWFAGYAVKRVMGLQPLVWRDEYPQVQTVTATVNDAERLDIPAPTYTRLRERHLGFLLNFTEVAVAPVLRDLPTAGVWSFQLNDATKYDGRIPGFWELYRGDKLIRCALVRDMHSGPIVLRHGTFRSMADSYIATASIAIDACIPWPRLAWQELACLGTSLDETRRQWHGAMRYAEPSSFQVLVFLIRLWMARVRLMFSWCFFREQWCVGIIDKPIHSLIGATCVTNVRWLFSGERHRYFADPFGIVSGDEVAILAEEYPAATNRGKISSFSIRDGVIVRDPAVVLELDGHLSYPYLFRHQDALYCIPESNELSEITLYQITRFPDQWIKVKTLLHGKYVDPTLIQHEDRWWLFASSMEYEGVTTLYVWHAADLLGEWIPHTGNPVKMDVCTSRPAGTPFVHEGQLYRPAQNCSITYGGSVVLNRITRLTANEFEEEVINQLQPEHPGPFPLGLHTLSAVGERTLIDGKTYLFSLEQARDVLRAKLRRIF